MAETVGPIELVPGASIAYSRKYAVDKSEWVDKDHAEVEALCWMRDELCPLLANQNLICSWQSQVVDDEGTHWIAKVTATIYCRLR